jgi:exopolyphosphatase/guanosine-5'-triphosphate,3'-diphosphate pyrophosphatase
MTERHLHDDPPSAAQVAAVVEDVRRSIDRTRPDVPWHETDVLVGVAGTVTTVVAMALGLGEYEPSAIHGARVDVARVAEIVDRLVHMDHDARAAVPVIHPGRVDVIVGGALILGTVIEAVGVRELIASEHDILDGIALSLG